MQPTDHPTPHEEAVEALRSVHYQATRLRELVGNILAVIEHSHNGNGPHVLAEVAHAEACKLTDELEEADRVLTMLAHKERHGRFTTA